MLAHLQPTPLLDIHHGGVGLRADNGLRELSYTRLCHNISVAAVEEDHYVGSMWNHCSTAPTVLQSSQQGDDTSVPEIPVVVQTHQVAVEHPAQLEGESSVVSAPK